LKQTRQKNSREKTRFAKEKNHISSGLCTRPQKCFGNGKTKRMLEHPPYSPDLVSSDFCLFPRLKIFLAGQRFSSNQEAIAAVEGCFADLTKNHHRDGIMALEHRWNKCIGLKGNYVEK
jgi:histone-lysine N-methyltransferase SETMAR